MERPLLYSFFCPSWCQGRKQVSKHISVLIIIRFIHILGIIVHEVKLIGRNEHEASDFNAISP